MILGTLKVSTYAFENGIIWLIYHLQLWDRDILCMIWNGMGGSLDLLWSHSDS